MRALLLTVCCSAGAANAGGYWAIGAGNASYDIRPLGYNEVDDSFALRVLAGTRKQYTGFEVDISVSIHDWVGTDAYHTVSNTVVAGLAFLPLIDNLEIFVKGGINASQTTVTYSNDTYDGDYNLGLSLGSGIDLTINPRFHLRGEYQFLSGIGDGVDEGDIQQITINGVVHF